MGWSQGPCQHGIHVAVTTLEPDCARCVGLCCVALPFRPSHGFAFAKDAGEPCRHLDDAYRCSIHASLREAGMGGCTSYECFGAGQHVTQVVYAGATWRGSADGGAEMFAVFAVVQRLHEMLVLLDQASALAPGPDADPAAGAGVRSHLWAARGDPRHRPRPAGRAGRRGPARGEPLGPRRRAVVRRTRPGRPATCATPISPAPTCAVRVLIAADLRDVVLDRTDLLGADLRDTDLSGADLSTALFLTQPQLNSARGSAATLLPPHLRRPLAWLAG